MSDDAQDDLRARGDQHLIESYTDLNDAISADAQSGKLVPQLLLSLIAELHGRDQSDALAAAIRAKAIADELARHLQALLEQVIRTIEQVNHLEDRVEAIEKARDVRN